MRTLKRVSGEASLDTVNPVTDSQVWQRILVVWLVLLFAMLMSFGLDCDCGWFSIVCRARFGHQEERENFGLHLVQTLQFFVNRSVSDCLRILRLHFVSEGLNVVVL